MAVAGHAKGQHVFGANFGTFAYNDTDASAAAISCEIGGGILSPAGGNATLLMLKASGGNVGGGPNNSGAFILMKALVESAIPYGIRVLTSEPPFSKAFISAPNMSVPVGVDFTGASFTGETGSALRLTSVDAGFGIEFNAATFRHAVLRFSATAPYGINFSGGEYATAAIRFDDGHNVMCGSTVGTQFGTAPTQKLGFWGKSPTARQIVSGDTTASPVAVLRELLSAMDTAGLINDATT